MDDIQSERKNAALGWVSATFGMLATAAYAFQTGEQFAAWWNLLGMVVAAINAAWAVLRLWTGRGR